MYLVVLSFIILLFLFVFIFMFIAQKKPNPIQPKQDTIPSEYIVKPKYFKVI